MVRLYRGGKSWGSQTGISAAHSVPDLEMGVKVVAREEQMREEILSTEIQE